MLGKTIKIQDTTSSLYARIYVKMNIKFSLSKYLELILNGKSWNKIINYENIPFKYRFYWSLRHGHRDCDRWLQFYIKTKSQ